MKLPSMKLSKEALSRFDDAIQKEWIITNGLGGYASSTVLGINTRKYHGILVAAFHPPIDRRVCLAKLDEEIAFGNETVSLYANEFRDVIFPQGHNLLKEFDLTAFPQYFYAARNVEVHKTVLMPHSKNVAIVLYKVINKEPTDIIFRIFPLVNWRDFHGVTDRWHLPSEPSQNRDPNESVINIVMPASSLLLKAMNAHYRESSKWIEKVFYREEARRGESSLDDCYQPGFFETTIGAKGRESIAVMAVADKDEDHTRKVLSELPSSLYDIGVLQERESEQRAGFLTKFYGTHPDLSVSDGLSWLSLATDAFVVNAGGGEFKSVIAGYHWFGAWGRDAFVSLPGLLLITGRFDDARKVFLGFARHCKQGVIPNFVPEQAGEPGYNSVDASLWFINAVQQYAKYTGDFDFIRNQLWDTVKSIIDNFARGTLFGIHVENDGLLAHESQLTWMDAITDGQAVTPRAGKAVEVQALWYNALRTVESMAGRFNEPAMSQACSDRAAKTKQSFTETFWNVTKNCLYDVAAPRAKDSSLRPNQILAVSLDYPVLERDLGERVVDTVERELLTPYGLRTLAKNDSRYIGVYAGDRRSRDRAYHNGTVWPWLLGPFVTALLKVREPSSLRREQAFRNFVMPLFDDQLHGTGLGMISEVFDGDAPHLAKGCIAQAWSIAEPLRAYVEDILLTRPRFESVVLQASD